MAQILVIVAAGIENLDDPYVDAKMYKRGQVVSIREDDDVPYENDAGIIERLGTYWAVVHAPGPATLYSAFTAPDEGDPILKPMMRRRSFAFDLDECDGLAQVRAGVYLAATADAVLAAKVALPALVDPLVFSKD